MADIYLELGDDESAGELINMGLEANPDAYGLQLMKGIVLLRQGDLEEAKLYADEGIALMPENPMGYQLLGDIHMFEKNWGQAAVHYGEALKHAPESEVAQRIMLKSMRIFSTHKHEGKSGNAEQWTEVMQELDTLDSKDYLYKRITGLIRAGIWLELGDSDAAVQNIQDAANSGWMDYKTAARHPLLEKLHDIPAFQEIMKTIQIKADSLRIEIKAVTRSDS